MGVQHSLYNVEDITVDDVLESDAFEVPLEFEKGLVSSGHRAARKALESYMEKKRLRRQLTEVVL